MKAKNLKSTVNIVLAVGRWPLAVGRWPLAVRTGFTLIELLVVVLIIGILAAIALPQYQKTVEKTKHAQLLISIKNLIDAQEIFYLANGYYADRFDQLDIDYPGAEKPASTSSGSITSDDAVRRFPNFEILLNNSHNHPFYAAHLVNINGKYKNTGLNYIFYYPNSPVPVKQTLCFESLSYSPENSFCQGLLGFIYLKAANGVRWYK